MQEKKYFKALDSIRVLSIVMICWLHLWEQSWHSFFHYHTHILKYIGITDISLETLVRTGYIFVDNMLLLSAVVNFLPYARAIVCKEPWPDTKEFYKRRFIRIVPSYLFCVLFMFVTALIKGSYTSVGFMLKDLFTRLTFTSVFFPDTARTSLLNGVLWTVMVEVWFYILIPFIAKLIKKAPVITISSMFALGTALDLLLPITKIDLWWISDSPISFLSTYGIGFGVALLYYFILSKNFDKSKNTLICICLSVASVFGILMISNIFFKSSDRPLSQLLYRPVLAILFGMLDYALMLAPKAVENILGNKFIRWICLISYNLYIWHQVIAFWLKDARIPYWAGTEYPNMTGDREWMLKYMIICSLLSILVAIITTIFIENGVKKMLTKNTNPPKSTTFRASMSDNPDKDNSTTDNEVKNSSVSSTLKDKKNTTSFLSAYCKKFTTGFTDYKEYGLVAILGVIAYFIIMAMFTGQHIGSHNTCNSYSLQADSWRQGRLDLGQNYGHLEIACYDGKYYISFPPFPSFAVFPLTFIFHANTPDHLLCLIACVALILYLYKIGLYFKLRPQDACLSALFLLLGTNAVFNNYNPSVWFWAQTMCLLTSTMAIYYALKGNGGVSLFCWAASVGCRPMQALYVPILLIVLYYIVYRKNPDKKPWEIIKARLYWAIPPCALAGLYMLLNYLRFDNPLEFGHNYLPEFVEAEHGQFSLYYMANNLKSLLHMPEFSPEHKMEINRFGNLNFMIASPYVLFAVVMLVILLIKKQKKQSWLSILIVVLSIAYLAITLMHRTMGGWSFGNRYANDILPWMYIIGVLGISKCSKASKYQIPLFMFGMCLNVIGTIYVYNNWA